MNVVIKKSDLPPKRVADRRKPMSKRSKSRAALRPVEAITEEEAALINQVSQAAARDVPL